MNNLKISLASKIANDLRTNIILGILEEGQLLNETALAEKYGVSRGPIRQAIQLLSNEGLVESLQNGRTQILGFRPSELQDYYNIRLYIESESVKKILSQPADEDYWKWLDSMKAMLENSSSAYSGVVPFDNTDSDQDMEFHFAIVSRANSQIYSQVWKNLFSLVLSITELHRMYYSEKYVHETNISIACHKRILEGLQNRDLDFILNELSEHMQHGAKMLTHTWEKVREEISQKTT